MTDEPINEDDYILVQEALGLSPDNGAYELWNSTEGDYLLLSLGDDYDWEELDLPESYGITKIEREGEWMNLTIERFDDRPPLSE